MTVEIYWEKMSEPSIYTDIEEISHVFLENGMVLYRFWKDKDTEIPENLMAEINLGYVREISYEF